MKQLFSAIALAALLGMTCGAASAAAPAQKPAAIKHHHVNKHHPHKHHRP